MNYSKLLLALFLFISLVTSVPILEDLSKDVSQDVSQDISQGFPQSDDLNKRNFNININENTDISSLVTDGIIYLVKNNICSSLNGELTATCNQISGSVINSISNALVEVIRSSLNVASGNSLSVACSIIPSEIFKNLSSITVDAITRELQKIGNTDTEKINNIANNVLVVIINSIENFLCVGKNTESIGNVIVNGLGGIFNNIIKGRN